MKNKKNRFWLFVFSLCPGAGHLYMGFMKMGLSFLLGFMLSCAVVSLTELAVIAVIPITIYIYAFFHANNIGSLDDERFYALEDRYLLGFEGIGAVQFHLDRKYRSIAAVILILIGISMLWEVGIGLLWDYIGDNNAIMRLLYHTMRYVVPKILMAIAIIWFGVYLLRGKKVSEDSMPQIEQKQQNGQAEQDRVDVQNGQDAQDVQAGQN